MDITIRWSAPSDASASSAYRIERALTDIGTYVELAATQAATSPYVSPASILAGDTPYGSATVSLVDASSFSSAGFAWLDDALIEWTAKSSNDLTGVVWHSGYGTYASGSYVSEAHESYSDTGVTITVNVAVYRITHIDAAGDESPPAYLWFFAPPKPVSKDHCVIIVSLGSDVGLNVQVGETVVCELTTDTQFGLGVGQHLRQLEGTENSQMTNAFGLAFFQLWKESVRSLPDSQYTVTLPSGSVVTIETVPDRDWVLLSQLI